MGTEGAEEGPAGWLSQDPAGARPGGPGGGRTAGSAPRAGCWTVTEGPAALEAARRYLMRSEPAHDLMIGVLGQGGDALYLAAAVRDGRVGAVGLRNTIQYLLSGAEELEAVDALARRALESPGDMRRWQGPPVEAARFGAVWRRFAGRDVQVAMRMRIYQLDAARPVPGVSGQVVPAAAVHRPLLASWTAAFAAEAHPGHAVDPEALVDRHLAAGTLWLWEDAGQPVSMAAGRWWTPHGARINLVYTPPVWRRRGYASACVAAVSAHLLSAGRRFCSLYADLSNPTSNALYQRIGYRPVCDIDAYGTG